jgi:6-phosphogluconolactonase (cycloisomerase 2 family)
MRPTTGFAILAALVVLLAGTAGSARGGEDTAGAVYTLSNAAAGNSVLVFTRAHDGTLTPAGSYPTGGLGTGSGLGSQGALVRAGNRLVGVDAGSNQIAAFDVKDDTLTLASHVASGGVMPISVTVHHDLVYVLNAGDATHAANITGFTFRHGMLEPLDGSTRSLSTASPGPAQVEFTPDGHVLVVTEKDTNRIDTYVVGADALATGPDVQPSAGATPFGFEFDKHGNLIVSDAFGGAAGASALSSYDVARDGTLTVTTPLAPDGQTAACWVVVTKNGRYAYTTNTGSANVSSYTIEPDGSISLLHAIAGSTGATPIDAGITQNGRLIYTLDSGGHDLSAFTIAEDGSLTSVPGIAGLPASAVGLAAR